MGEKTFGQIAYEAWLERQARRFRYSEWHEASDEMKAEWEAVAEAVRDAVNDARDPRSRP